MIIAGNGIYEECSICGRLVKVNKFLFGSLHVCLSPEERKHKQQSTNQAEQQKAFIKNHRSFEAIINDLRKTIEEEWK